MLPDAAACCAACFNHTTPLQCSAYVYGTRGTLKGRCYLKTSLANSASNSAFTSGTLKSPSPSAGNFSGPAVTAFATTTPGTSGTVGADAGSATGLSVFLGYWNDGGGPDRYRANRTVTVTVHSARVETGLTLGSETETATASIRKAAARITQATEYRIDHANANPLLAWKQMGSPNPPSADQLAELITASKVTPRTLKVNEGQVVVDMAANSAVLVVFKA